MKKVLITGCNGLIGSQCVEYFCSLGKSVVGIDNDMRSYFFGENSSTKEVGDLLKSKYDNFEYHDIDIRNLNDLSHIFESNDFELIIHTAAQPSHDWAAKEPITDFEVNALGTVYMLESYRQYCPDATFIFTSTNKVYGDRPNYLNLVDEGSRIEHHGGDINEDMSIDNCLHSVFGASKVSADVMVQEYGRYFGLNTMVFRGGCLTGPSHKGAELHGFLSYLIKCMVHSNHYTIFGNGKQVRDNIHSWDLVNLFWHCHQSPRSGEVYNIGGGRENSISILETISKVNEILKENNLSEWNNYTIEKDNWRIGDHKWYISDLTKVQTHYPEWKMKHSLNDLITEMTLKEISQL